MSTTSPGFATLRIGTRGSALAIAQANLVREALDATGVAATLVPITTDGDRRAPDTAWGEGAFVSAIESALLHGEVDIAVHSAKDVPTDEDPRLMIAAYPARESPADVIVVGAGRMATSLESLPAGSRVGTDSPRRVAFLRALRPDLAFHPLHGNVDTRLRRLDSGETDALVLAEAGLSRLGRSERIAFRLEPDAVPSAPGQGALAVQVRASDGRTADLVARLDHLPTRRAVEAERALLAASGGGCRAPVGAVATVTGERIEMIGGFARPDGSVATIRHRSAAVADTTLADGLLDDLAYASASAAMRLAWPRLIVTRAAEHAAALLVALVDRGLSPLAVPAIEIQPGADGLARTLARLPDFDWVVVTSANAVRAVRDEAGRSGLVLGGPRQSPGPRWAAVGVATARELHSAGIPVAVRPARSSGAALAGAIPVELGERVLFPRSEIADAAVVDELTARGAVVESVVAYRTLEGPESSVVRLDGAMQESPKAVMFTSGSTVRGLLTIAERLDVADAVRRLPAICIGPETAAEARRLGFEIGAEARSQGVAGIADAAASYLIPSEDER
jgi:hydroxymethylbilane synthase